MCVCVCVCVCCTEYIWSFTLLLRIEYWVHFKKEIDGIFSLACWVDNV